MIDTSHLFQQILSSALFSLPNLLISIAALLFVFSKWKQAPTASLWAMLAFALLLVLSLVTPTLRIVITHSMMGSPEGSMWAFTTLSIASSILYGLVFVLCLIAIYAGRGKPSTETS